MNNLPIWNYPGTAPAFNDTESFTVIEATAKVYAAMRELIAEYNNFSAAATAEIEAFKSGETTNREEFEKRIVCLVGEYTRAIDEKINAQDSAVAAMVDELPEIAKAVVNEAIAAGKVLEDAAARGMIADLEMEQAALNSRMNTFASLPEGEGTAGNAELLDIRVGYDGKTYETAGEAVRGQARTLKNSIKAITEIMEVVRFDGADETPELTEWTEMGYIYTENGSFVASAAKHFQGVKIWLKPNTQYKVSFFGHYYLYDQSGANGVFGSKENYDSIVFDGGESGRYVGINHDTTAVPTAGVTVIRLTPELGEGKFEMPDLIVGMEQIERAGKKIIVNTDLFDGSDETPELTKWTEKGYIYTETGSAVSSQYTANFQGVKIWLKPNTQYKVSFFGHYYLYDQNGANGVFGSKENYDSIVFDGGESGRYVGINHDTTAVPTAGVTVIRLTPEPGEGKFEMPDLILKPEQIKTDSGKIIVNFGDSIFGAARPPYDISTKLAEITGATVHNCGFGGCHMGYHTQNIYDAFSMYRLADAIATSDWSLQTAALENEGLPYYFAETVNLLKSIDFSKVDIVTIGYGINDFNSGNTLHDGTASNPFYGFGYSLEYSIEKLLNAFPNLRIFICTMTYCFDENGDSNSKVCESWVNGKTSKYTDFIEEQKRIAKAHQLPIIDNYYELGINKFNKLQYFAESDGVHHNQNGRNLISAHMASKMW